MSETEKDSNLKSTGKGRPTPKRKDREKANVRPLVGNRSKEAMAEARARQAEARKNARQAMMNGDEKYLLGRDRGPQRKIARELIDGRLTFIEMLMPLMVVILLLTSINDKETQAMLTNIMFVALVISLLEITLLQFKLKKTVKEKLDADLQKGSWLYLLMRGMQPRPLRIPKPAKKVKKK